VAKSNVATAIGKTRLKNRLESWLFSIGIHGVLLLGATLVALQFSVLAVNDTADFSCEVREGKIGFDQLYSVPEVPSGRTHPTESCNPLDGSEVPIDFMWEPVIVIYYDVSMPLELCSRHVNGCCRNIRFVGVKFDLRNPLGTYQDRRRSFENSRQLAPRLKCPAGRHSAHLLGFEVVCRCREHLQSPHLRGD